MADLLPHKSYSRAELILAAGRREYGKTTFIRRYVSQREPRVIALDPFEDFDGLMRSPSVEDALRDLRENSACRRRVVPPLKGLQGLDGEPSSSTRQYGQRFFDLLFDEERGARDCLVLIDEVSLWTRRASTEELERVILQGRRLGIRIIAGCQRIQLVPGEMLSEMTELVLFRITRPRDLEVVEDWAGETSTELVPNLKVGECVWVSL